MMPDYSNGLTIEEIRSRRLLRVKVIKTGPVLVFFTGIHGNEPAGKKALDEVLQDLNKDVLQGSIYVIQGNLEAIAENKRFLDRDLNRMWTSSRISNKMYETCLYKEDEEQKEILEILHTIIEYHSSALYFIDLHTTSSRTLPFITINDSLINRRFAKLFPVPVILGIEEYLQGTLLSYINELGYVALGFESGQHSSRDAVKNAISFIKLAIHFSGIQKNRTGLKIDYNLLLEAAAGNRKIYEVVYRYIISENEQFRMKDGYESFLPLQKGTLLATSNNKNIYLKKDAVLFMPLYQEKGEDGYYLVRKIAPFFLRLSSRFRNLNLDEILSLLPGVKWENSTKSTLIIDLRTARFLAKPIFHLLGYRSREYSENFMKVSSRDRVSKTDLYKDLPWYKKTLSTKKGFS